MKVLQVITRANLGGAQRVVLELSRELRRRNHEVRAAIGEDGWLVGALEEAGITTNRLPGLRRSKDPLAIIRLLIGAWQALGKEQPDVVHLHSTNTLPVSLPARVRGCRVVFTVHGLSLLDDGYEGGRVAKAAYRAWFRTWFWFVDRVVCVSARNAERLETLGLARGKTVTIPLGLDPDRLDFLPEAEARRALGVAEEVPVAILLGRLEYAKHQALALDAWPDILARVPDATLVLVGDGPDERALRDRVAELGIGQHVVFAGAMPDAYRILKGANLVLLTSRYEGWPIVLLEALAAGRAIVARDVGGIAELLGGAGTLLPREATEAAWAEAIAGILADSPSRASLEERARHRAGAFTARAMGDGYEAIYRA